MLQASELRQAEQNPRTSTVVRSTLKPWSRAQADCGADPVIVEFDGVAALAAHQELAGMGVVGVRAADIGVQALDPVDKTLLDQKIERPIDRERCDAFALDRHVVENGISAARTMPAPYQFKPCRLIGVAARRVRRTASRHGQARQRYSGRDHAPLQLGPW